MTQREDELNMSIHNGEDEEENVLRKTSEGTDASSETMFHPISCNKCRTNHKKCDKKLPMCSYCASRGIACEYDNPRKRGKGSDQYPPEPKKRKIKIQPEWKEIGLLDPNLLVEFYYDYLSDGLAVLPKHKFTYFVTNCLNQFMRVSTEPLTLETNDLIKSEEEMRGLYIMYSALLTVYYQFHAKTELATLTASICEKEITKHSIECFENLYFVAGCHTIALFFLIEGSQEKKGKFFGHYVTYFFKMKDNIDDMDAFEKNFYHSYLLIKHVCEHEPPKDFKSFISGLPQFFQVLSGRNIEDVVIPEVWEYLKSAEPNSANYMIFKQLLENVFLFADQHKKHMMTSNLSNDSISKNYLEFESLIRNIIHDGFRLLFYGKIPELAGELIEEVALRITLQTENDLFKLALPAVDIGIRKACEFHLKVSQEVEMGLRDRRSRIKTSSGKTISFDNYSLLEKDLKAIKLLASRFKSIYNIDKELIAKCEEFLKRQEEKQQTQPSITMLPPIDTNLLRPPVHIEWNHHNQDSFLSSMMDFVKLMTQNNNGNMSSPSPSNSSFGSASSSAPYDPWSLFQ
ncbi:predicted protein [Naegleria gruberi]|uniref:Predicted protein n=1 Tax=Naegleria gruberi TaxID=5762 RepID=D2UZE0_NAEGR|nr:uncharacterized protein NAEGRDRAFT_61903 [Naegleria gruberi]EFC49932.1 predicted protein [Naegleria gruberi]|eukprot:XP_002682676.1 predicted protein [Naegleria gruberi strain NEG-M]